MRYGNLGLGGYKQPQTHCMSVKRENVWMPNQAKLCNSLEFPVAIGRVYYHSLSRLTWLGVSGGHMHQRGAGVLTDRTACSVWSSAEMQTRPSEQSQDPCVAVTVCSSGIAACIPSPASRSASPRRVLLPVIRCAPGYWVTGNSVSEMSGVFIEVRCWMLRD